MFNNFSENHGVYVEKSGTARQASDDNITQRMRFACWITKARNTPRICNTHCFSTTAVVRQTHLGVTSCFFAVLIVETHLKECRV